MEFSIKRADSRQKLNTKGCCFLCLEDILEKDPNGKEARQTFPIRNLLEHLQITLNDQLLKDIQVDLCESCGNLLKTFQAVFLELTKVQMKMNYLLDKISECISGPGKDSRRVQIYSKSMTHDPEAFGQLEFVDNLRKELAVKSHESKNGRIATVKLKRISNADIKIKQEVSEDASSEEAEEDPIEEDFDLDPYPEVPVIAADGLLFPSLDEFPQPIKSEEANVNPVVATTKANLEIGVKTKTQKARKNSIYYKKVKETGMFECKKCGIKFQSSGSVSRHYQSVHLKKRFKCEICNIASYAKLLDFKFHQKTCRETLEERLTIQKELENSTIVCNFCEKKFRTRGALYTHRSVVHKNINRYPCDLCGKRFSKLCNLKAHKDVIHFGKVFSCRFCNKQFRSLSSSSRHEIICEHKSKIKTELVSQ